MIGAPSARNMGAPVKLTHGIKPPETLKTGPKVVWLNEAGGSGDDAGGRIKARALTLRAPASPHRARSQRHSTR